VQFIRKKSIFEKPYDFYICLSRAHFISIYRYASTFSKHSSYDGQLQPSLGQLADLNQQINLPSFFIEDDYFHFSEEKNISKARPSFFSYTLRKSFAYPQKEDSKLPVVIRKVRRKEKKSMVDSRLLYYQIVIRSSLSNCIVTIVNPHGNVVRSFSCGSIGFLKAKRSTYYAAQQVGIQVATYMKQQLKIRRYNILVRGIGYARKAVLKGFRQTVRLYKTVRTYKYDFSIPHNGCRSSKKKRR
jgi:ribosomal protein S11